MAEKITEALAMSSASSSTVKVMLRGRNTTGASLDIERVKVRVP